MDFCRQKETLSITAKGVYYAYDTKILCKAFEVLGLDNSYYIDLHSKIKEQFIKDFPEYHTQTECVLALRFNLTPNRGKTAALLVKMIHENADHLSTGLVGTPHILHALSENGFSDLAYSLLLSEEFPSWLFTVNMGATTMWEHWDGINKNGLIFSKWTYTDKGIRYEITVPVTSKIIIGNELTEVEKGSYIFYC